MKSYAYFALISAAIFTPISALAAQPECYRASGHFEWRLIPRGGSYIGAHRRKHWVADKAQTAAKNCNMMKMSGAGAASCIKAMGSMPAASGSMMKMGSAEAASCVKAMGNTAAPSSSPVG